MCSMFEDAGREAIEKQKDAKGKASQKDCDRSVQRQLNEMLVHIEEKDREDMEVINFLRVRPKKLSVVSCPIQ